MKRIVFGSLSCFMLMLGCSAAVDEKDDAASSQEALRGGHRDDAAAPSRSRRHPRRCESTADCGPNRYCEFSAGECGGRGKCQPEPEVCTRIYKPVCGCNGVTYGNACEAAAAGVSVSAEGACPSVFCGGIANLPCPGSGQCVDDPSDDCDPQNGGADCGGVCQCIENALCVQGSHFDSSPKVCACVPDEVTNPCAAILCPTGTECVVEGDTASCEPPAGGASCGDVTCSAGTYCCNASCGWCLPPGMACIQIACD